MAIKHDLDWWVTTKEAADIAGVHRTTLYKYASPEVGKLSKPQEATDEEALLLYQAGRIDAIHRQKMPVLWRRDEIETLVD